MDFEKRLSEHRRYFHKNAEAGFDNHKVLLTQALMPRLRDAGGCKSYPHSKKRSPHAKA